MENMVTKLLKIRSVREIKYPGWLANVVVVPKKNGMHMVYFDYTNLNKERTKDSFSLPHIDQQVVAITGYDLLFFWMLSKYFIGQTSNRSQTNIKHSSISRVIISNKILNS